MFEFENIGFNKITMAFVAGIAGSVIVGYCYYFDKKRRSDSNFKKNLRERRLNTDLRKSLDEAALEEKYKYFQHFIQEQQELQMGVHHIVRGNYELGSKHLANAVLVSGDPIEVIYVMQQALPPQVFDIFITKVKQLTAPSVVGQAFDPDVVPPAAPTSTTEQSPKTDSNNGDEWLTAVD